MNYLQKKKLAFMSIVNRVKGFVRTVTGVLPLTLTNCVDEESVIDYTIYGNSVQDGTPTPDTPVEVESVGEYDEQSGKYKIPIELSGKNLYNKDTVSSIGYLKNTGEVVTQNDWRYTNYIRVGNETVVVSGVSGSAPSICAYDGNKNFIFGVRYNERGKASISVSGMKYVRFSFSALNSQIQLEEGSIATEYEPYHSITTNIYLDEPLGAGQFINYKKDGLPTIPTFKGTSVITANTTIQPSKVEIEYYSTEKE